jgi:GNAT superfamily N-acetyltransferase
MTPEEFVGTQFPSLAAWIREGAATGLGSRLHEQNGIAAQVSPAVPDASLFNSVTYRDADALRVALPRLESIYAEAGVRAWTVWVQESDFDATALVRNAGHVLDGAPEGMGCALDELVAPDRLDELDYTGSPTVEDLQLVLSQGYGFPLHLTQSTVGMVPNGPRTLVGIARAGGRPACTVQVMVAGEDAGVYAVATVPEARGRGLARRLQYVLLQRARELGARTTTLQASKLGRPVYLALGYRCFGAMNMWERRQSQDDHGAEAPAPSAD